MLNTNKSSGSKKLILAAFLVSLSITAAQAIGNNDLEERAAKAIGNYAGKSSLVQQGVELVAFIAPDEGRMLRRYIPPPTTWGRFKQKCSELFDSMGKLFGCTSGTDDD